MKDWTGNKASTFAQLGASNHTEKDREINDYYATSPKALLLLLLEQLQKENIKLHNKIWECACGEGHLSEVLKQKGHNVTSTDLIDRGYGIGGVDFLNMLNKWDGDILTNPPYKNAKEFVEHSLELQEDGYYTIMFLKIQFLEGKDRYKMFQKYPPKYVYVNSSRQTCAMNGKFDEYNKKGNAICYCWFIWEKGFKGEPIIRWIKGD